MKRISLLLLVVLAALGLGLAVGRDLGGEKKYLEGGALDAARNPTPRVGQAVVPPAPPKNITARDGPTFSRNDLGEERASAARSHAPTRQGDKPENRVARAAREPISPGGGRGTADSGHPLSPAAPAQVGAVAPTIARSPPPKPPPVGERPPQAVWATRPGAKAPSSPGGLHIAASDPRWRALGEVQCYGYPLGEKWRGLDGRWHPVIGVPGGTVAVPRGSALRDGDQVYVEGVGHRKVLGFCSEAGAYDVCVRTVAEAHGITGRRRVWRLDERGER